MIEKQIVANEEILTALNGFKFDGVCVDEGRLMILELLSKAGAGHYNSHTEELFLSCFDLMRKDRTPNKRGLRFIRSMLYNHSNYRPLCFDLMEKYRRPIT